MTPASSSNAANPLKRLRDDGGQSPTAPQAPGVRALQLVWQPALDTPQQPPLPMDEPDAQSFHRGAEFGLLPDAKAIVLSYLPGAEICMFVHPELWELVKDSPVVNLFLQATQRHDGLTAAQATVGAAMSDNVVDQRRTMEAAQTAGAVRLALGRALTSATYMGAPPEHLKAAQDAYDAADSAYDAAVQALQSALARPGELKKELVTAAENLFGAHVEMRKGLDAIRWVGAPDPMSALGIVADYSDKDAPLDPAAALQEKERLEAEGAQKSGT